MSRIEQSQDYREPERAVAAAKEALGKVRTA
jgi:hypothetical protein